MPYYTAIFQEGMQTARYARWYSKHNHEAERRFRSDALTRAAAALGVSQNDLHGSFTIKDSLPQQPEYEEI